MKDIKVKEYDGQPKVRNPASRMPKELVRATVLEMKEKSHQVSHMKDNGMSDLSATEYASEKLESAEEWVGSKTWETASTTGRKAVRKSYEKIKQGRMGERAAKGMEEAVKDATEVYGASIKTPSERGTVRQAGEYIKRASNVRQIRLKPRNHRLPSTGKKYSVKRAPRTVKTSAIGTSGVKLKNSYMQSKQAARGMQAARKSAQQSVQTAKTMAKRAKTTVKGMATGMKATAAAVKSMFMGLGTVGGSIILLVIVIAGVIAGAAFSGNTESSEPLSTEVLAYTSTIQRYATQYGIPDYVSVIQAIMMQESGGKGTDPMQSSECSYNTKYPNSPNAITDPEYSIQVGVQYYADCVKEAGSDSPYDMDKLKLSLQGYNYGNGYITWAIRNHGGYSTANALQFSKEQAVSHGWAGYGDPEYVPHVLRYYSGGNLFAGLFGNNQMVTVAKAQLGNEGGQKFWAWYGFQGRVEWCACFVSWCAEQSGMISSGDVLKFSYCPTGVEWFQSQGKWRDRGYTPTAGMLIFFDWENDGTSDHVGIVEKYEKGVVYTIEGNSGDAVRQRSYDMNYSCIMGYGQVK